MSKSGLLVNTCIGIDFGMTNSVVAVSEAREPRVIENPEGFRTTPSMISVTDDQILVGVAAKRQMGSNIINSAYGVKRLIGRKMEDEKIDKFMKGVPYKIVAGTKTNPMIIELRDKKLTPNEITKMIITRMKEIAEANLGGIVKNAVVSVPTYYSDLQKKETMTIVESTGLKVRRLITEPTAAAIAYGMNSPKYIGKQIVVFDMGGATLDCTLLKIESFDSFKVLSTSGDFYLGGDDFDMALVNFLAEDFKKVNKMDLLKDRFAIVRLSEQAERVKVELTNSLNTEINLPYIAMSPEKGPLHINMKITRAKFESLTNPLLNKIIPILDDLLKKGNIEKSGIDEILLVGGMSRVPKIQDLIEQYFGKKPMKMTAPEEAIAMGNSIKGDEILNKGVVKTKISLNTKKDAKSILKEIKKRIIKEGVNTGEEPPPKPLTNEELFNKKMEDRVREWYNLPDDESIFDEHDLNDIMVAVKQSVDESPFSDYFPEPKLPKLHFEFINREPNVIVKELGSDKKYYNILDKLPVSICIKTPNGNFVNIIDSNTPLPLNKSITLSTMRDKQRYLIIPIYQHLIEENKYELLTEIHIKDITPLRRGSPNIKLTMNITQEGVGTFTGNEEKFGNSYYHTQSALIANHITKPLIENLLLNDLIKTTNESLIDLEQYLTITNDVPLNNKVEIDTKMNELRSILNSCSNNNNNEDGKKIEYIDLYEKVQNFKKYSYSLMFGPTEEPEIDNAHQTPKPLSEEEVNLIVKKLHEIGDQFQVDNPSFDYNKLKTPKFE